SSGKVSSMVAAIATRSGLLHPGEAVAARTDRAVDDLAARRRNELHAVVAAHVAIRLVLILHRLLRHFLLCRSNSNRHDGASEADAGQSRRVAQKGAPRQLAFIIHGKTPRRTSYEPCFVHAACRGTAPGLESSTVSEVR